jgi:hypothetical protein
LVGDVYMRAVSMVLDIQARALEYDVEIGRGTQKYADIGSGTRPVDRVNNPTPGPTSGPGGTDPNDPLCTGGDPRCTCVRNDPQLAGLRSLVGRAVREATIQHAGEGIFQPQGCVGDECTVVPGREVDALNAFCEVGTGQFLLNCHPNQGSVDEIVVDLDVFTVSFDVILGANNGVRTQPQSVARCEPGVQ